MIYYFVFGNDNFQKGGGVIKDMDTLLDILKNKKDCLYTFYSNESDNFIVNTDKDESEVIEKCKPYLR